MALESIHLWLARFDSFERWCEYLDEDYSADDDEQPINEFAVDQNTTFYDHDTLEANFSPEPPSGPVREWLATLLSGFAYSKSWLETALHDAVKVSMPGVNAVLSIETDWISDPCSAAGQGYEIIFVGTYEPTPPWPRFDPTATELNLNHQRLTEIPAEVFNLTGLEQLSVADNLLSHIPEEIGRLVNLRQINIYDNKLSGLPDAMFALPRLRTIMAQNNALRSLPASIGSAPVLRGLSVYSNDLTRLPDEIGDIPHLDLLDVSGNELTEVPPSLGKLKS